MSSSEDDDLLVILHRRIKKRRVRRFWIHPLNLLRSQMGEHLKIEAMHSQYPQKFFEYTRMTPRLFDSLLSLVQAKITKKDTNWRDSISARTRLFIALR